jgi:hypothetical protein
LLISYDYTNYHHTLITGSFLTTKNKNDLTTIFFFYSSCPLYVMDEVAVVPVACALSPCLLQTAPGDHLCCSCVGYVDEGPAPVPLFNHALKREKKTGMVSSYSAQEKNCKGNRKRRGDI